MIIAPRLFPDLAAAAGLLLLGGVLVVSSPSSAGRVVYGGLTGLALVGVGLAVRHDQRRRRRVLLEELASFGYRPGPDEDITIFLIRTELDAMAARGMGDPVADDMSTVIRSIFAEYRGETLS